MAAVGEGKASPTALTKLCGFASSVFVLASSFAGVLAASTVHNTKTNTTLVLASTGGKVELLPVVFPSPTHALKSMLTRRHEPLKRLVK